LRLGVTSLDSPYAIKIDVDRVIEGCMAYFRDRRVTQAHDKGGTSPEKIEKDSTDAKTKKEETGTKQKSRMMFTIQIDGGHVTLPPLVEIKLPMTRFSGERSSSAGLFVETFLDKFKFAYGMTELVSKKGCPTLQQIASLPENVRMHILLCLKDLTPLEKALCLKHEKNAFRRIKSVDKGILKVAKTLTTRDLKHNRLRKSSRSSTTPSNRRQEILSEIMSLDDTELSELWTVHQRYQRKLAKKRNEGS
jgi:hypothetical protein